jgi:hypothetical protein
VEKLLLLVLSIISLGVLPTAAQELAPRTANPHGALKVLCENCHTTTAWKPIRRQPEFDHNRQTSFALQGLHQSVPCQSCHVSLVFSEAPTRCAECHADLHRRQFGPDCEKCHTVRGWDVQISAVQQHSNRFPLLGAHSAATCDQCHFGAASGVYTGLSTQCVSCHLKDYQRAAPLNHVAARLPTSCETCHGINTWLGARFSHAQFTSFALIGMHATLACSQCHTNHNFALTGAACINCHLADFNNTTNPPHRAAGYPVDCTLCHGTAEINWTSVASFDHGSTGFALTGAHTSLQCAQCHSNNNFGLASGACVNCHLADFNSTTNPPHKSAGFPQDCSACHTTANWNGAAFNHTTTGFTLVGAHATQQCAACHVGNNFSLTSTACMNCHATDFNNATNPPHKAAGFPQDCTLCHGTAIVNWNSATFDHGTTAFTLVGAHATQQCAACHVGNNFSLTSTACINCHLADFNTTTNPPHKAAGFPQDCTLCHGTAISVWTGAKFDHGTTGFTLVGAHATQQCAMCHVGNNFSLTSTACMNCHATDFNNATNPPHKAAGFPQDCTLCHGTTIVNWTSAPSFNHSATGFTLTGAHANLLCGQCHGNNNFGLNSASCINCHLADFNNANSPPHKAGNFPQDCSGCHTTVSWSGATFNHAITGFALTGAHTTQQCAACHSNNNYSLTSGACINCHLTEFNGTTNPPHKAAGFPQDCTLTVRRSLTGPAPLSITPRPVLR